MALTINTNVASLNAQRNLGRSQTDLNQSMQRLSSGLRINSAKDDAAGLAISDRMTAQITGLNQAVRNANDGISLSQTAEGALQESTNILQRIRELGVQSANDTNSASDRESLQAEVDQLILELDRIADTTQFNGKNLLDGTMNDATFQVGANAGVSQTISFSIGSAETSQLSYVGVSLAATNGVAVTGDNITATAPLAAGSISVNGTDIAATASADNDDIAAALNAAAGSTIATAVNVQTIAFSTVTLDSIQVAQQTATTSTPGDAGTVAIAEVQMMDLSSVTVRAGQNLAVWYGGSDYKQYVNSTAGDLTGSALAADMASVLGTTAIGTMGDYVFTQDTTDTNRLVITQAAGNESSLSGTFFTVNNEPAQGNTTAFETQAGQTGVPAAAEEQYFDLAGLALAAGETITFDVGGEQVVYTNNNAAALTGADLASDIALTLGTTAVGNAGDYQFSQDGGVATRLNITQAPGNESDIDPFTADFSGSQTLGSYQLDVNGTVIDLAATSGPQITAAEVATAISDVADFSAEVTAEGAIQISYTAADNSSYTLAESIDSNNDASLETGVGLSGIESTGTTLTGQISIDSSEELTLTGDGLQLIGLTSVGNATTTIDQVDISTREGATIAISSVDAALSQIDTIRGDLGAVQNRFESTIANLQNVSENLSAARSRILDADIAAETSSMTKQNILQQAGVSILAQANQAPQLALSLLG